MTSPQYQLKLRDGVLLRPTKDGFLELFDETTNRCFRLSGREQTIAAKLRSGCSFEEVSASLKSIGLSIPVDAYLALYKQEGLLDDENGNLRRELRENFEREQLADLRTTLNFARQNIPLYEDYPFVPDPGGNLTEQWRIFTQQIPLIDRCAVAAAFPERFLPSGIEFTTATSNPRWRLTESSGTTSDAIQIFHDRSYLDAVFRSDYLYRDIFKDRHAIFAPQRCMNLSCNRSIPPFHERYDGHALLMAVRDPMQLTETEACAALQELEETGIRILVANPNYLAATLHRAGNAVNNLLIDELYLGYNFCQATTVAWVEDCLGVTAGSIYGMSECGYQLARTCSEGKLHLNEEFFVFETIFVPEVNAHRLVVSTLRNPISPLIRYLTDDFVTLDDSADCACGSILKTAAHIEGRITEIISIGTESRTLGAFDQAFGAIPGLLFYQLICVENDLHVFYVAAGTMDEAVARRAKQACEKLDLPVRELTAQRQKSISLGESGKFTAVRRLA